MLKNILKLCLVSCIYTMAIGGRTPQIKAIITDVYPDGIKTDPFVRVGNKLYYFGPTQETWFMASLICRSMDGFLASVANQQEMKQLSDHLKAKYPTDHIWWLSGSDLDTEGDFYWYSTGERMAYADWSKGEPNHQNNDENCVFLWYKKTKYEMNDAPCNFKAYYVCEADNPKTVMVSIF